MKGHLLGTNFLVLPKGVAILLRLRSNGKPPKNRWNPQNQSCPACWNLEDLLDAVIDPGFTFQSRTLKLVHKVVYYPRKSLFTRSREGLCHWDMPKV